MASTILVVDDEAPIREVLAELLEEDGYRVVQARNGREALGVLAREAVDLVVSDVMMPLLDGIGLVHVIRTSPSTTSLPIILLTAGAHQPAASAGADALLAKPFTLSDLEALVRRCLDGRAT